MSFSIDLIEEARERIGIGAVLGGALKVQPDEKVCFLISGGNCAISQLDILNDVAI